MIAKCIVRTTSILLAALATACSTPMGGLIPWVPQGPGNTPEEARAQREAKARGEPAPAPAAAATRPASPEPLATRRMEVAPELVAQTAPPPRSPGQQAAPSAGSAASYTQGTRYGDLVFISGQIALDVGSNQMRGTTIEEQTRQVMENVRAVLESHRLTFANLVSVTVYMKDINDFRGMNATYESYFRGALPARSVVAVSQLPRGGLIELSAIAGR
ncbi:MAG TPA: Rid family detoxifying hydrolase [Usitatibacter sp.]|nr:Rid family detoxifying hydrolase [Usitatibacter sp.]